MNATDRSGVIRFAEAQKGIPGPAGERSVLVLQRGTLDVKLALPVPPNQQTPHAQDEIYVVIRGRGVSFTMVSGMCSSQAISCSSRRGPSITTRT